MKCFDDSNSWFLEVEYDLKLDLETCQRPWFTNILILWASQGPKNLKKKHKEISHFCHKVPKYCPRGDEKDSGSLHYRSMNWY